jgi:hypothetical protein
MVRVVCVVGHLSDEFRQDSVSSKVSSLLIIKGMLK